ncbi:hypothetical protein EMIT051CA3_10032 [Pseudomonas chlororaphis]
MAWRIKPCWSDMGRFLDKGVLKILRHESAAYSCVLVKCFLPGSRLFISSFNDILCPIVFNLLDPALQRSAKGLSLMRLDHEKSTVAQRWQEVRPLRRPLQRDPA